MKRQENKTILVDANTILRYLLKDVPELYEKAEALFKKVRTGEQRVEITEGMLAEAVYVLLKYYRVPKPEVVETLNAFLLYKVDCLLAARAKVRKLDLFTFDKELLKAIG
jgi:predicted nucleic acid-binding protein